MDRKKWNDIIVVRRTLKNRIVLLHMNKLGIVENTIIPAHKTRIPLELTSILLQLKLLLVGIRNLWVILL